MDKNSEPSVVVRSILNEANETDDFLHDCSSTPSPDDVNAIFSRRALEGLVADDDVVVMVPADAPNAVCLSRPDPPSCGAEIELAVDCFSPLTLSPRGASDDDDVARARSAADANPSPLSLDPPDDVDGIVPLLSDPPPPRASSLSSSGTLNDPRLSEASFSVEQHIPLACAESSSCCGVVNEDAEESNIKDLPPLSSQALVPFCSVRSRPLGGEDEASVREKARSEAKSLVEKGIPILRQCYFSQCYDVKFDVAILTFSQAIQLDSSCGRAFWMRALCYDKMGDASALADYSEAMRLDPTRKVRAMEKRAEFYKRMGDYESAILEYSKLIRLDPDDLLYWFYRADCYNESGDVDGAAADFGKLTASNGGKGDEKGSLQRGLMYLCQGKLQLALATLSDERIRVWIRLDGPEILSSRGLVRYLLGDLDTAQRDVQASLDLIVSGSRKFFENRERAGTVLSLVLFQRHSFRKSLSLLNQLLSKEGLIPDARLRAHWVAALASERLGLHDEALVHLEQSYASKRFSFPWLPVVLRSYPEMVPTIGACLSRMADSPAQDGLFQIVSKRCVDFRVPGSASLLGLPPMCPTGRDCWESVISHPAAFGLRASSSALDHSRYRCFCTHCMVARGEDKIFRKMSNGAWHGVPVGWTEFGVSVSRLAVARGCFSKWHVAFHGTTFSRAKAILDEGGELLIPGDRLPNGTRLPLRKEKRIRDPKWAKHIFFSKSSVYAAKFCRCFRLSNSNRAYAVMLRLRVRHGSYEEGPETILPRIGGVRPSRPVIDECFRNSELEWMTDRRSSVQVVGLLVKCRHEVVARSQKRKQC